MLIRNKRPRGPETEVAPEASQQPHDVIVQFCNAANEVVGPELSLSTEATRAQLLDCLEQLDLRGGEKEVYAFRVADDEEAAGANGGEGLSVEIETTLEAAIAQLSAFSAERPLRVCFVPLANFRIRPVTRCTSSLKCHTGPVTCLAFNPQSTRMATGGGDTAVRIWDMASELPLLQLRGHTQHVRELAWSPDGELLASAGVDATVRVWRIPPLGPAGAAPAAQLLKRHKKAVSCLVWQPFASSSGQTPLLASGSLDGEIILWDVVQRLPSRILSSHTKMITAIRFSGRDDSTLISVSRDTRVIIWNYRTGEILGQRPQHASWINSISLNTDFQQTSGGYDPLTKFEEAESTEDRQKRARSRFDAFFAKNCGGRELAVTCSDDCTAYLWDTATPGQSIRRLTGHQDVVVECKFSPDARFIATASFDKSVRIWDGSTGNFLMTLRGHVGQVYRLAWSPDSRYVISGGGDALVKIWAVAQKKAVEQLDAHGDAIYALDWARDGTRVATGSKDSYVKFWQF